MIEDALAQFTGAFARMQHFHLRDALPGHDRGPAGNSFEIVAGEPRLLRNFAPEVALKIDRAVGDIAWIGGAGDEVNLPSARGMRPLDAEQERSVGAADRRHRETVVDAPIRKIPVAPSEEARKIGFEIGAAEYAVHDLMAMQE